MPLADADIKKTFIQLDASATLADLLKRQPDRAARLSSYVVVQLPDGSFHAECWPKIETYAFEHNAKDVARTKLGELAALLPATSLRHSASSKEAVQKLIRKPPFLVVITDDSGAVLGVYAERTYGDTGEGDPFAGVTNFDPSATLGDDPQPEQPPQPQQPQQPAVDDRVFNAWLDGQEPSAPLQLGQTYDLKLNVDSPRKDSVGTVTFDASKAFQGLPPEVQQVEITVAIDTDDFTLIGDDQQTLIVPRVGKSKNSVTFTIEPKHNGPGTVNAVFIARNRIFQKMTITLQVGELVKGTSAWQADTRGLAMSGSVLAAGRSSSTVNLVIERRDAGYNVKLIGAATAKAFLNLSETKITELILRARDTLKNLVYYKGPNGQYSYQQADTTVAPEVHKETLKTLAKLGYYLYQEVFFAPGNGVDAQGLGNLLRQISQQQNLEIAIVAERFIFPWALLYDREVVDQNNIDPQGFWGFKHIVQYMPEFANPTPVAFNPRIGVTGNLKLGFICNTTIDDELSKKGFAPVIKPQREFFKTLSGVDVTEYPNRDDLYTLLKNEDGPDQVWYFYCHAVSNLPGEAGGVDGSRFVLSDGVAALSDLKFEAGITGRPIKVAPLVFINACQSAELSPFLYDGLVPYLVAKGMRGVIGTEVDTPALFAAEFAQKFLQRFTAGGETLGSLLLELRQEYLTKKNNVMGLIYALYSNGEVVVARAGA